MDPGNWATDIEGGAKFGYRLIWVLLMANAMAVLLQTLSARLGLVTGRDLAQACHDEYPPLVNYVLFVLCEIAIAACDLAEVLGTAIGLNLLFRHSPALGRGHHRRRRAAAVGHAAVRHPQDGSRHPRADLDHRPVLRRRDLPVPAVARRHRRGLRAASAHRRRNCYVAIGILGATVMPHNLYLHSALVQSRDVTRSREAVAEACKYNLIDSAVAMNCAFLVNAAILIVAAATFFAAGTGRRSRSRQAHDDARVHPRQQRGPRAPSPLALICAGQSSTITGTLAGQITMEGFLRFRIRPWLRRLITRTHGDRPGGGWSSSSRASRACTNCWSSARWC